MTDVLNSEALIARFGRARAVRIAGLCAAAGVASVLALPGIVGVAVGLVLWGAGVALVFPAAMSAGGEQPGRAADGIATVSTISTIAALKAGAISAAVTRTSGTTTIAAATCITTALAGACTTGGRGLGRLGRCAQNRACRSGVGRCRGLASARSAGIFRGIG